MARRVVLSVTTILALALVGCGGDNESSSSEPTESPATTETVATEPTATEPVVTEPVVTEPATTDPSDSTEPASTDPDVPPVRAIEVDDDPVCEAFARVYAASFFQGLAGALGGEDGATEKIELYFAPALAPDVVVIRTQGASEFQAFPTLARVDAGIVALTAGGFTDAELIALAASGNDTIASLLAGNEPDLESVGSVPDAEGKLSAAAAALLADVGTLDEFFEVNADAAAEAAFTEMLSTQCPTLIASFQSA